MAWERRYRYDGFNGSSQQLKAMVAAVYQSGHSKRDTRSFMHSSGIFGWEVTEDMHKWRDRI